MKFHMGWALPAILLSASIGGAAEPVAIVEEVSSSKVGVAFMDYLASGRVIRLGKSDKLVLGYLRSCWRETISGGQVTVGPKQSRVDGGRVVRERVECDGGSMNLTQSQSSKSGVIVFRAPPGEEKKLPKPQLTIYGISPVIILPGGGEVVLNRLDRDAETFRITVKKNHVDLANLKKELIPGGLYKATARKKSIVFTIDAFAHPGKGPIVSRLIPFRR